MPLPPVSLAPIGALNASATADNYASCVIVCVGRSEHLAITLPQNATQVDELVVVTTSHDIPTQDIVRRHGGAKLVISDRCYHDFHAFNKGRMINDGLRATTRKDWVILTDADIFLNPALRSRMKSYVLNPEMLFGTIRFDVSREILQYPAETPAPPTGPITDSYAEPNGHFQLFNHRAAAIRDLGPDIMSEAFCSAGSIDSWLLQRFPEGNRWILGDLAVAHIEHDDTPGFRWNAGANPAKPSWRQFGILTGKSLVRVEDPPARPLRVRMVDTCDGGVWEGFIGTDGCIPVEVAHPDGSGGLVFRGKPIGRCHIHVAWWTGPE